MVGKDPRGGVGIELLDLDPRAVPVDQFIMFFCGKQLVKHGRVRVDNAGEVHKFAKSQDAVVG